MDTRISTGDQGFIPFGVGCRQCPGELFVTTTFELTLANLLYHFDWTLTDSVSSESLDMGEVLGMTLHQRTTSRELKLITMDELSVGSLCFIAVATLGLSLALKRALLSSKTQALKLPPGPWNLPVIGSIHHLLGSELPHRALLRLAHRHGPLMLLRLGEVPTVVVSSPEAAMEVMKGLDPAFAERARGTTIDIVSFGGKGIVFAPYGEHWRQVRKICVVDLLSARQVRRLETIRQEEVTRLVDSIAVTTSTSSPIDMTQTLASLTNDVIARAVFGGRCRQQEEYLRALTAVALTAGAFSLVDLFPSSRLVRWMSFGERQLRKHHAEMVRIVNSIIQERREEKASPYPAGAAAKDDDDLLDVLLRLQKEDSTFRLTAEIIGALISDIFGAATDTTASTLEWALAELIRHPRAMEKVKEELRKTLGHGRATLTGSDIGELHYLKMVIKETLRLHPAFPLIVRASQESCQVMGYDLPQGINIFINAFAVARDPRYWKDAEEFNPNRFEKVDKDMNSREFNQKGFEKIGEDINSTTAHLGFIPFGAGRRQCPGALFATTTIELTLANLLYHFDWTLHDGESPDSLDMGEVLGISMHRRSNLRLQAALSVSSGLSSHSN
uniref:Cytochrome P450 n=1 Tax=Leersia perrieri TaxID=77586 RepID=A0A0D9VVH7_9ORYZ